MIIDHCRNIQEFKKLYTERPMPRQYDFEWLIHNPYLFCFYDDDKLLGFITIQDEVIDGIGKVLTLSGTSIRKIMPKVITAIMTICNAFSETMYSVTPLKEAGLVLKRAGFEKIGNNLYRRNTNGKK